MERQAQTDRLEELARQLEQAKAADDELYERYKEAKAKADLIGQEWLESSKSIRDINNEIEIEKGIQARLAQQAVSA